jgi:transcriptional regulator with XRE-family HTH domain
MTLLAARSGTTHQNVSLIERGQRPKDRTMDALAQALEVDRSWLFFVVPSRCAGRSSAAVKKAG